jgi:hypothetical protein
MPRFAEEDVRYLKDIITLRLPGCYFTSGDVEDIKAKTGLEDVQIQTWADHMRYRVPIEKRVDYLATYEEYDKVCYFNFVNLIASQSCAEKK